MGRGMTTPKIQKLAKELLGIESLSIRELRLMPYIQYVMVNDQKIDPRKINSEERAIFMDWKKEGWVVGGMTGLSITKEFWDAINEIMWIAYVVYNEEI